MGFSFSDVNGTYTDSDITTTTLEGTNVTVVLSVNITDNVLVSYGLGTSAQGKVSLRDNETGFPILMMFNESLYEETTEEETSATEESSSSSSGSSGTPTYYPTETNLQEGYPRSLGKGWNFRFDFKNESHKLNVDKIDFDFVTITISSDPITFDLEVNDSKKVDLDSDGYYDFLISLNEITGSSSYARAEVYVLAIDEKIAEDEDNKANGDVENVSNEIMGNEISENGWGTYMVLVLIIIFGVGLFFMRCKGRRR